MGSKDTRPAPACGKKPLRYAFCRGGDIGTFHDHKVIRPESKTFDKSAISFISLTRVKLVHRFQRMMGGVSIFTKTLFNFANPIIFWSSHVGTQGLQANHQTYNFFEQPFTIFDFFAFSEWFNVL